MNNRWQFGTFSRNLVRLTAGMAIAAGLLVGMAAAHPHPAAADDDLGAPTLLNIDVGGNTAYVSFRDNSSLESGYLIYGYVGQTYAAFAERSGVPDQGRTATVSVENINPNLSYCFTAFAADVNGATGSLETDSPPSNQICTTPPAAAPTSKPAPGLADAPLGTKITPDFCVSCIVHSGPSLPDLAVTDVRSESSSQLSSGATAVYDAVVANTGAKLSGSGQVQVQIQVSGSVSFVAMAQTPAGFSCSSAAPVICVGPIGGQGDPPITTSATFRVQVHADRTGVGSLSAAVDPNNLIQESDESNDARTLAITVK